MKILHRIALGLLLALTIAIYIPQLNHFSSQKVTDHLHQAGAFNNAHQLFQRNILNNPNLAQNKPLQEAFTQAVTPNYIQQKTESTLHDAENWVTRKTDQAPIIDLNDLKEILSQHYPQADRLEQSLQELNQSSTNIETLPQVTADPSLQSGLNALLIQQETLTALSQGQAQIHLKPFLEPLRLAHQAYTISLYLLPLLFLAILGLPLLLSRNPTRTKLNHFGKNLVWSSALSAITLLIIHLLTATLIIPQLTTQLITRQPLLNNLLLAVWTPLSHNALLIILTITGLGVITGVSLYILTRPKPTKPELEAPQSPPPSDTNLPSRI